MIIQLADPDIIQWIMETARKAAAEAGRDPDELKCIVSAPSHVTDDLDDAREQVRWFPAMVSNHVQDLIDRYGTDGSTVPKALTDYVQARKFYDYNEHSRVGAKHGEFVTDEICDRFCVIGIGRRVLAETARARVDRRRPVQHLPDDARPGRDAADLRRLDHPAVRRRRRRKGCIGMPSWTPAAILASLGRMSSNGAVVNAVDLVRRFGEGETAVDALRGVSLAVGRGELVAVMGPSGSGKSTLMHILAALDKPTSGTVSIAGEDVGSLSDRDVTMLRRKHIGFVFQFFNLLPMLTAEENVLLPLSIASEKPDPAFFADLMKRVGLDDRRSHRPAELSGGQQQRVAIARSLVARPTVVFADEPTGNLDSKTGREILELLRSSTSDLGQTMVMVTHDAQAASIADRVLFLADGLIVRELGRTGATEILATMTEISDVTRVALQRHPRPQAEDGPDRGRDRARRRDGERHVRADRLDRQGVQPDLHRRAQGIGRGDLRQGCDEHEQRLARADAPGVASRQGARASGRRRSRGQPRRDNAHLIGHDGKAILFGGRAEPRVQHLERRVALQSAYARVGHGGRTATRS